MIDLTTDTIGKEVAQGVTLVDFWAPWCGPCKMLAPVLERVEAKLEGKARIAKVNVDDCPDLATEYQVSGVPCMLIFKDGEVVRQMNGPQSEKNILKALEEAM